VAFKSLLKGIRQNRGVFCANIEVDIVTREIAGKRNSPIVEYHPIVDFKCEFVDWRVQLMGRKK
jgi:hypothetical protein